MRHFLHRRARASTLFLAAATSLLGACGAADDERTLQLPRTAQELEDAARRGDSMAAMIAVGQALADTLVGRAPALEAVTKDALTPRALRRADSLARVSTADVARTLAPAPDRATRDSLRGVLQIEHSASGDRLVLNAATARMPVALGGIATSDLSRLAGFDVVVRGARMSTREFVVSAFVVRGANGAPVDDGVLTHTGNAWSLQLAGGGELRLTSAPAALQLLVGERVWVARDGNACPAFGPVLRRR